MAVRESSFFNPLTSQSDVRPTTIEVELRLVALLLLMSKQLTRASRVPTIAQTKVMRNIFTSFQCLSAVALLALFAGCATTKHTEQMLTAAGFKVVVPHTPQQEQQIKTLPADKLTVAKRGGKTYYVFPDPTHNQLYVGSPQQYQTYQQILSDNKISAQNRVDADMAGADGDNDENRWAVWTENSGWVTGSSY